MAILALLFGPMNVRQVQAQIFLDDESMWANNRPGIDPSDLPNIPWLGITIDQYQEFYAPLGDGVFALGLLGGAYLLNKKRKEKE